MTEILLTIFFISVLLFFLGSGIWVALSMIGVSAIGMMLFTSRPVGDAMATTIWGTSSSWTLTALPLFVWMGEILFRTKLSENLFKGLSPWMQKLPGGLIHVNIVKDNNGDYKTDWDVQSCESFENDFGKWSKCNPGMELPV